MSASFRALARRAAARYPPRDRYARHFAYGKLTREEMAAAHEQRGQRMGDRRERMRELDKDGDQMLSRAEVESMPKLAQNFDSIDVNRDGKLCREEMRAAREQRREHEQR